MGQGRLTGNENEQGVLCSKHDTSCHCDNRPASIQLAYDLDMANIYNVDI